MAEAYCFVCQTAATSEIPPDLTLRIEYILEVKLNRGLPCATGYLCDSCRQKLDEIENLISELRRVYTYSKDVADFQSNYNKELVTSGFIQTDQSLADHPQTQITPGSDALLQTTDALIDDNGADDDTAVDNENQNTQSDEEPASRKPKTNYSCGCGEVYYGPRDLEAHRKEKHEGGVPCRDCGVTLKTPSELQAHSLLHKKDAFNCDVCGLGFHRARYLKNHQRLSKRCSRVIKGEPTNQLGRTECGCGAKFNTPAELKTHRQNHHGGRFVCPQCARTFGTYGTLTRHMFIHSNNVYECKKCCQSFKHPTYLQIHQRRFHRVHIPGMLPRSFKPTTRSMKHSKPCTRSKTQLEEAYDATTDTEDQGKNDMERNGEAENSDSKETDTTENSSSSLEDVPCLEAITEMPCPVCDMTYQSEAPLVKHITACHWQHVKDSGLYQCVICSENQLTLQAAVNHGRGHRDDMHSCNNCDCAFVKKDHLLEHSIRTHKGKGVTVSEPLQCEDCGHTETSRGLLSAHILIEHNHFARLGGSTTSPLPEKPHQCSFCNMSFKSRRDLQKHTSKHTRALRDRTATPYSCPECNKPCKTSGGLDKHIRNFCPGKDGLYDDGTGQLKRSFRCGFCGAVYKTRSGYEMHLSKHTGQGEYQCPVCQQRFRMKGHLTKHVAVHTRPYMCAQCGNRFSTANHLNEHQVIHSTELKFTCSICNEKFRWRLSLVRHQWRSHGIGSAPKQYRKLVMCKFCRAEVSRTQRANHIRTYHPEVTYNDRHFKCLPRKIPGANPESELGEMVLNPNNRAPNQGIPSSAPEFTRGEEQVSTSIQDSSVHNGAVIASNDNKPLSSNTQPALFTLVNATHQMALMNTGEQYVIQATSGQTELPDVTPGVVPLPPGQQIGLPQQNSLVRHLPQPALLPTSSAQNVQGDQYPGGTCSDTVNTWTPTYAVWQ